MKKNLFLILFTLVLPITAAAQETIFPTQFKAPAEFNTGDVHISVLSRSERQMTTNFLFEKGSRNSWHYHPNATQVLMVLSGEAFYQEEGKPKQLLRKGDVVTTDEEFTRPISNEDMIVRIAEIEVYPQYLKEYLEYANEVDRVSVEREPGVICLFPMQSAENSTTIRILEIYASEEAYQSHIKTDHFQKYKQGTLHMVKDLKLPSMKPLDPETMKLIFKKQR